MCSGSKSLVGKTYRSVFPQLTQGGEGFLMRFSDFLCQVIELSCHLIVLYKLLFQWLFLLLVSVISDCCKKDKDSSDTGY